MFSSRENEPLSAITHFVGMLLSIAGLVLLIVVAAKQGTGIHVVAFSIFGATMLILYLASTVYHFVCSTKVRTKRIFKIIDHAAIYLLIAGTYTPVALIVLPPGWGWAIFGLIWLFATLGMLIKITQMQIPAWVSVVLYLLMGWLIVIAFVPLSHSLPGAAMFWLVLGGLLYTLGAIFFALDKAIPRSKWFGMHEIFHIFVMLGSFAHYWMMFRYVVYIQ